MGRRRKQKPEQPVKETKSKPTPPDSLAAPNHMAPLWKSDKAPWPELYLMKNDSSSHPTGVMFVADEHKTVDWWSRDTKAPPTWMDPCIFTQLLLSDPEVVKLLDKAVAANSQEKAATLPAEVERVFINEYLVYALKEFRKVKAAYSQWLIARYSFLVRAEKGKDNVEDPNSRRRVEAGPVGRDGGAGGQGVVAGRVPGPGRPRRSEDGHAVRS